MRGPFISCMLAGASVLAAGWYHRHARQSGWREAAERHRLETAIADTQAEIRAAREKRLALARDIAMSNRAPIPPPAADAASGSSARPSAKPAITNPSPELREMQVRAFVSEQRLRFAATLKRLAPDARKPGEFDRIQRDYQQALLEESQTAAGRQQARETRDAELKELFGPDYEQWAEANRTDPARGVVTEIVRITFPSSGALTTTQADELTRIVDRHRVSEKAKGGGQARYDWDAIIEQGGAVLDPQQKDDFAAAIRFRRASEEMSALAASKK